MRTSEEITKRIKEIEGMPAELFAQHRQELSDCYWARRRAWEREQNIPTVCHDDGSPV